MSSQPITERVFLRLKPNVEIEDAVKDLQEIFSEEDGFQEMYWGHNIKERSNLELLVFWASLSAQKKFLSSDLALAATATLSHLSQPSVALKSSYLSYQPATSILSSPVTEILTYSQIAPNFWPTDLDPLLQFIEKSEGSKGVVGGMVTGSDVSTPAVKEDSQGRQFVILAGWESEEANRKGKESEGFGKLPKVDASVEVHHVKFKKVE